MRFGSSDPSDLDGRVVWWRRLELSAAPCARIQVEVVRTKPYRARLSVFDRDHDRVLANVALALPSPNAVQPSQPEIEEWNRIAHLLATEALCEFRPAGAGAIE